MYATKCYFKFLLKWVFSEDSFLLGSRSPKFLVFHNIFFKEKEPIYQTLGIQGASVSQVYLLTTRDGMMRDSSVSFLKNLKGWPGDTHL